MNIFAALLTVTLCSYNKQVLGITGGEPAEEGEFPYMVSIKDMYNCHFCAGTIIGDSWVLSNGECYYPTLDGSISFGSNKLAYNATHDDCGSYNSSEQRKIDSVIYNTVGWDQNKFGHDLLLIHVTEPIPLGEYVEAVQLPEANETWPFNETGIILGWGYGSSNLSLSQTYLQKAKVSIYSDEYCNNTGLWNGYTVFDPTIMKCGGEVNKTYFCFSDYGGPLLINEIQYGIISYAYTDTGGECGTYLGLFSPTMTYREWIREQTGI